jgi:hypothetical protein
MGSEDKEIEESVIYPYTRDSSHRLLLCSSSSSLLVRLLSLSSSASLSFSSFGCGEQQKHAYPLLDSTVCSLHRLKIFQSNKQINHHETNEPTNEHFSFHSLCLRRLELLLLLHLFVFHSFNIHISITLNYYCYLLHGALLS